MTYKTPAELKLSSANNDKNGNSIPIIDFIKLVYLQLHEPYKPHEESCSKEHECHLPISLAQITVRELIVW